LAQLANLYRHRIGEVGQLGIYFVAAHDCNRSVESFARGSPPGFLLSVRRRENQNNERWRVHRYRVKPARFGGLLRWKSG
jgi:hypothetical protein